ncbi:MAG: VTT domain-containing protein [Gemmatimonadales bacterium]
MADARRRTLLLRLALVALGIAALVLGGRQLAGLIPAFVARVTALGALAPVVFVLAYAAAVVAFIPGSLLTLAAGAAFGLGRGVVVVLLGATLGGSLAFLIARYAARAHVARAVAGNPRFAAIDRAIGRDGRRMVFLLRLSPVFPFNLLNYGLGLTTVRFTDYVVASIGMLPGTILYVYYGKVAGDVAALASGAAPARGAGHYVVLALGLAATIGVTVLVTRTARRALAEAGA